jgi:hypothetical protein
VGFNWIAKRTVPRQSITWLLLFALLGSTLSYAQELEPRRWSHLPVGANFMGVGGVYTDGSIKDMPSLQLRNVDSEVYTGALSYVRVLDVFGKSGRIDVLLPYSAVRWDGLLRDEPAAARKRGFNDPRIRFAVNVLGSPAQRGKDFVRNYSDTIVGAAVEVTVPVGQYTEDRLLNVGGNRWVIKPQLGVVRNWGKWAGEVTASAWLYGDNDEFYLGSKLEQDPVYGLQSHLIYTLRPGLWVSLSGAYGAGGSTRVDGDRSDDRLKKTLWAFSFGFPIDRRQGFKLAYVRGDTHQDTGSDSNQYLFAYSMMWGG